MVNGKQPLKRIISRDVSRRKLQRKSEHQFPFSFFPAPPTFRVPFTFTSSSISESLEQARSCQTKHLTMELFTTSSLLPFVLTASLICRTLTTPVATQHSAVFDKIARVNQQYGKNLFLLSTEVNICLPMRCSSKRMRILSRSLIVQSPEHKMMQAGFLLVMSAKHF